MLELMQLSEDEVTRQVSEGGVALAIFIKRRGPDVLLVPDLDKVIRDPDSPDIDFIREFEVLKKAVDKAGRKWCKYDGIWGPCDEQEG